MNPFRLGRIDSAESALLAPPCCPGYPSAGLKPDAQYGAGHLHGSCRQRRPKRNKGLLGRDRLSPGEGLWIIPCEAVHTFWMRFPIDLVYLDRKKRIRKLASEVPPWRLSACLWAHSVLELPPGTIRNTQTQLGDRLEFSIAPMP